MDHVFIMKPTNESDTYTMRLRLLKKRKHSNYVMEETYGKDNHQKAAREEKKN